MKTTKIYEARYCCCVYESSYATLSVHRTKNGAESTIKAHKDEAYKEWLTRSKDFRDKWAFDNGIAWDIKETDLLD